MMRSIGFLLSSVLILSGGSAFAMSEGCGGDCAGCHTLTVKEAEQLLKGLGGTVKGVKVPPVRGLWEVELETNGQQVSAFVDYGKKHLIPGPIYSIATRQPVAGQAPAPPAKPNQVDPATIPTANSIVMGNPKGKTRLFVFTDPDCPFCSKQHQELKKLVAANRDLAVYVKLFPLKIHPKAYDKSRVIMAGDAARLLDDNFAGRKLPEPGPKTGGKPVDETVKLADRLGIHSTPTLVLPDGTVLPGMRKADEIEKLLAEKKKK